MKYPDNYQIGGVTPCALADAAASKAAKANELHAIVTGVTAMNPHAAKPLRDPRRDFQVWRAITAAFRQHQDAPIPLRELAVLRAIYPARLDQIREGDQFAGRFSDGIIGFSAEMWGAYVGFYCLDSELQQVIDGSMLSEEEQTEARDMQAFWRASATHNVAYKTAYAPIAAKQRDIGDADWVDIPEHWDEVGRKHPLMWFLNDTTHRVAGPYIDGKRLIDMGVDGLIDYTRRRQSENSDRSTHPYYEATIGALELFRDNVIGYYEQQARQMQRTDIADTLAAIRHHPPQTLRQAIQLAWLYLVVTRVLNTGRYDVWFGDLYANDLKNGVLTETEAQLMVDNFWQLMFDEGHNFNLRVILGGKDREHVAAADQFALLCIEATRRLHAIRPQTTLRIYRGMNPTVYDAALKAIAEGCTFPMLLNDDVNIPAVAAAFGVSTAEAAHYVPLGCGEFVLETCSICTPNSAFPVLKCLEYALHDGKDALTGHQMGPHTGSLESFTTFEQLWRAYDHQVKFFMDIVAAKQAIGYQRVGQEAAFLWISALYHDCLERGKALMDGGVRYLDGSTEINGFVNTADSLTAIQRLVYVEKRFTMPQIVSALNDNFSGHEDLYEALIACPKYGNDMAEADEMALRVHDHVSYAALAQSGKFDALRKFLIVHVNNHAHVQFGSLMAPSADGRAAHAPIANANNPSQGRDVNGTTAMLKSLVKITPDIHAGVVQNMKFSKRMFTRYLPKTKALLQTYFDLGGTQAMLTVVSKEDLEDAMQHPERHQNLIVRVGGYSARFVDLSRAVQLEILQRTLGMSTTAIVFDIQRNSMEDGPGIRTTVFLKGCPMRCQWCHNPESFARQPQTVTLPNGTIRTYGKPMTAAEVFQIVLADRPFFETSGGGVTLSGGEPLLYPEFVGKLFADCQNAGIHTAVETNGVPVWNHYETILPHTDLLLFDYKATPSKLHAELTGVPSEPVLECLDRLVKAGKNIILRCPIVPTVNNNPEHLAMIARLSQHYNITVHLMPYHNTARDKWQALRLPYLLAGLPSMTDAEVDHTISQIVAYGAHAELIGLA